MKKNVHTYIGIFLIVIGILPFLNIGFGMLSDIVHVLTIVSGIVIIVSK